MGLNRFPGFLSKAGFRRILAFAVTVMVILLVLAFVRFRMQFDTPEKPEPPDDTEAALTIKGFRHTAASEGRTSWTVNAESARLFPERNLAELSDVDATFFTKDGSPVHLSAKKGKLDTGTRNISMNGSVLGRHKGFILRTENLHYKHDSNIIYTDTHLRITGDDSSFSADSGKFEVDTGTLILEGHVLVRMNQIGDF
ncbi:MAG: LPS export ABC transporter periplasmic protein LptC [Desulfobacteraceae bacterium]|nr:LPS export ABC transporter periplasmic protein LptC [Desulfobacteraceae bacterium]